ncbi:hypothetical protein BFC19_11840 [Brochothrix thermosphacta]|uniref:serine hydrolase n=1 Tax=Brochothrix thermosphacta TaxID=2756 RepID=UPI000E709B1F|nr:serine hydrolase [Brochothrix thermosphacta]ANZ96031.1 hypothetical protein BFC19_11840 [Brochothrix thermosphacta]
MKRNLMVGLLVVGFLMGSVNQPIAVQANSTTTKSITENYVKVDVDVRLQKKAYQIYSKPYGYEGYQTIDNSTAFVGNDYTVKQEAISGNNRYYYIVYGKGKAGWINTKGFTKLDRPIYKTLNKNLKLTSGNYNVFTAPYLSKNSRILSKTQGYIDNDYVVKKQAQSGGATYYQITLANKQMVWVNANGFKALAKESYKKVSIAGNITSSTAALYTKPYLYKGSRYVGTTAKNKGHAVKITESAITPKGVFYKVNGLGWLPKISIKEDDKKMEKVQKLLNSKYRSPNYGIYVRRLSDGKTATMHGNTNFTAASTGKLPAIYYTQKMINSGKIKYSSRYENKRAINNMPLSYQPWGAGVLQYEPWGKYFPIDTILKWTIQKSDNQGANFLGYYGGNQYSPAMKKEISKVVGRQWTSWGKVSAKDNAKLIEAIYRQGGKAPRYLQSTNYDNQRIPKYLPVPVGHKIGDLYDLAHDVGIVYAKEPYVISVMTKNYTGYEKISVLSRDVYNILK